ncbi:MAG: glycosyltransferase [Candidatus Nomurabacteria bacterium]|jgi:glycosyltransferase involved in cell wall biosynthesis|nr:glycosyltransferase [Candidatus Nomurabacteria bacterium]
MKIVISTDLYYPMINGVAVFSRNLATGLQKRGHRVIVLAPSITGEFSVEKDPEGGFTIIRLSSVRMPFYPDQISKIPEAIEIFGKKIPRIAYRNGLHVSFYPYPEIKRELDAFRPDLIHDQTPGPVALAVFRYAKRRNIPLVATGHAYPDNFTSQIKLPVLAKKPIDVAVRAYFASFLKKSEYATMPTELAIADLLPKDRKSFNVPVEALSNGIDLSRFSPGKAPENIHKKYHIPKNKPTIIYIGRVDPEKSLSVLVEAFSQVHQAIPEAQLVIVGDGSDKHKLETQSKDLGIEKHVIFTGRVVGNDLPNLYKIGTVFGISSTTETQSIVLMEAMASGLPAVAVKAGAIGELVKNSKNGYLCEPGDPFTMAKKFTKILSDPELRQKMSEDSLNRIKKHDIDHTLTRIEQIYSAVLDPE